MTFSDAIVAIEPVTTLFGRLGVPYYVGGSIASSAYGLPRTTMDADLVADLKHAHVAPLVEAIREEFYVSQSAIFEAIAQQSCFNVIHFATMFKVDVFILKARAFDQQAIHRARKETIEAIGQVTALPIASPEDIVLLKLEWYRLGEEIAQQQWRDVIGVLKLQREALDWDYLRRWAGELKVADLLDRAGAESGT
jgi:hypothetical protein